MTIQALQWMGHLSGDSRFRNALWHVLLCACAASCGGSGSDSLPIANAEFAETHEDHAVSGLLSGQDREGRKIEFFVSRQPGNGSVTVDVSTGAYTYTPAQDFNGIDSFAFLVKAGTARSAPAEVSVKIHAVNDPPTLVSPGPRTNDPDHYPTIIPLEGGDVDGDVLQWSINAGNPELAAVDFDPHSQTLLVRPRSAGDVTIDVQVSDGYLTAQASFQFSVLVNQTERLVLLDAPEQQALEFRNDTDVDVEFDLDVNNHLFPGKRQAILEKIGEMKMPDSEDSIPFRIWRAIAENTRRGATLSEATWLHAPARLLNSTGFGYCDDVASAFSLLASEAGFKTRVWTLGGHVVPEVEIGDRWEMYDPDTGVVYFNEYDQVANVEELAADAALITSPRNPAQAQKHDNAKPFSQEIADIYASSENNVVYSKYTEPVPESDAKYVIPSGGRLLFGGSWSSPLYDQPTGLQIGFNAEARLELPAGWLGSLPSAFVITSIEGAGAVRVRSGEYELGNVDLITQLSEFDRNPGPVEIVRSDSPITVTFLVNAVAGALERSNRIVLTGINTGAIGVNASYLPDANRIGSVSLD